MPDEIKPEIGVPVDHRVSDFSISIGTERQVVSCASCGAPIAKIGTPCRFCHAITVPTLEALYHASTPQEKEMKASLRQGNTEEFNRLLTIQLQENIARENHTNRKNFVEYCLVQNWIDWLSLYARLQPTEAADEKRIKLEVLTTSLQERSVNSAFNLFYSVEVILPLLESTTTPIDEAIPEPIRQEVGFLAKQLLALPQDSPLALKANAFDMHRADHLKHPDSISRQILNLLLPYYASVEVLSNSENKLRRENPIKEPLTFKVCGFTVTISRE